MYDITQITYHEHLTFRLAKLSVQLCVWIGLLPSTIKVVLHSLFY